MRAIDFKRIRTKVLKMTQAELAKAMGMSKRQIGNYEAARTAVPDRSAAAINALVALDTAQRRAERNPSKW